VLKKAECFGFSRQDYNGMKKERKFKPTIFMYSIKPVFKQS